MGTYNLEYKFDDQSGSFALNTGALRIDSGKIYFLHGRSGCGKTTILNLLSGVVESNINSQVRDDYENIAYVMHESTLAPWCSVRECIKVEERLRNTKIELNLFMELCDRFHLDRDTLSLHARHLSLGMRQRVEIAKAISFKPDLLLLDEAVSGIDYDTKTIVLTTLNEWIKESGCSVIGTAHQIDDLLRIAEEIIWIEDGRIEAIIKPTETIHNRLQMSSAELLSIDAARVIMNDSINIQIP